MGILCVCIHINLHMYKNRRQVPVFMIVNVNTVTSVPRILQFIVKSERKSLPLRFSYIFPCSHFQAKIFQFESIFS